MDLNAFISLKPTLKIFYEDAYLKSCEGDVLKFVSEGSKGYIALDRTIFHPQGGGQPSDSGTIVGARGKMHVRKVMERGNVVIHWGKVEGEFFENETVKCELNWPERFYNMKLHTAGHILDYAILQALGKPVATVSANHGQNAYIEYEGNVPRELKMDKVSEAANSIVYSGRRVKTYFVRKGEVEKHVFNAPNIGRIPDLEVYRVVEIEGVNAMPCGGTHVANTKEVGEIKINRIEEGSSTFKICYSV